MGRGANEETEQGIELRSAVGSVPVADPDYDFRVMRAAYRWGSRENISPSDSHSHKKLQIKLIRRLCDDLQVAIERGDVEPTPQLAKLTSYWLTPKLYEHVDEQMAARYPRDYKALSKALEPAAKAAMRRMSDDMHQQRLMINQMESAIRAMVTHQDRSMDIYWSEVALGGQEPAVVRARRGSLAEPGVASLSLDGNERDMHPAEMIALGQELIRAGKQALDIKKHRGEDALAQGLSRRRDSL